MSHTDANSELADKRGRHPRRLTRTVPAVGRSVRPVGGDPDSGNILIQDDNLEALKALLPFYAGRVKCIYIDPPYNTGSAFEHYDDNLEHTQWLGMIWPRAGTLARPVGGRWFDLDKHRR